MSQLEGRIEQSDRGSQRLQMDWVIQTLSRMAVFDEKNNVCWIKKINNNDDVSSNFLEWSETQFSH